MKGEVGWVKKRVDKVGGLVEEWVEDVDVDVVGVWGNWSVGVDIGMSVDEVMEIGVIGVGIENEMVKIELCGL